MAFKIKRKKRDVGEIPLSSTADIAFLLIVFFLAASALLEMKGVKIPLPKKDAPPMQVLKQNLFKILITDDGQYLYEKQPHDLDSLEAKMRAAHAANSELIIAIRVSKDAPVEKVPAIVQRVQHSGLERLSIGMDE